MLTHAQRIQRLRDLGHPFQVPDTFICPITYEILENPVTLPSGIVVEKQAAEDLYRKFDEDDEQPIVCPVTGTSLEYEDGTIYGFYPNPLMKTVIDQCLAAEENKAQPYVLAIEEAQQNAQQQVKDAEAELENAQTDLEMAKKKNKKLGEEKCEMIGEITSLNERCSELNEKLEAATSMINEFKTNYNKSWTPTAVWYWLSGDKPYLPELTNQEITLRANSRKRSEPMGL